MISQIGLVLVILYSCCQRAQGDSIQIDGSGNLVHEHGASLMRHAARREAAAPSSASMNTDGNGSLAHEPAAHLMRHVARREAAPESHKSMQIDGSGDLLHERGASLMRHASRKEAALESHGSIRRDASVNAVHEHVPSLMRHTARRDTALESEGILQSKSEADRSHHHPAPSSHPAQAKTMLQIAAAAEIGDIGRENHEKQLSLMRRAARREAAAEAHKSMQIDGNGNLLHERGASLMRHASRREAALESNAPTKTDGSVNAVHEHASSLMRHTVRRDAALEAEGILQSKSEADRSHHQPASSSHPAQAAAVPLTGQIDNTGRENHEKQLSIMRQDARRQPSSVAVLDHHQPTSPIYLKQPVDLIKPAHYDTKEPYSLQQEGTRSVQKYMLVMLLGGILMLCLWPLYTQASTRRNHTTQADVQPEKPRSKNLAVEKRASGEESESEESVTSKESVDEQTLSLYETDGGEREQKSVLDEPAEGHAALHSELAKDSQD